MAQPKKTGKPEKRDRGEGKEARRAVERAPGKKAQSKER